MIQLCYVCHSVLKNIMFFLLFSVLIVTLKLQFSLTLSFLYFGKSIFPGAVFPECHVVRCGLDTAVLLLWVHSDHLEGHKPVTEPGIKAAAKPLRAGKSVVEA
jgi:hypothetical protein